MSSVATYELACAIQRLGLVDDVALMMECAADAWQLSNNAFPYGLDLLARDVRALMRARRLFDARPRPRLQGRRLREPYLAGDFGGVRLRIWLRAAGVKWKTAGVLPCVEGVLAVDPYLNLDLMAASPDARFILELRAALAECLFIDEMPADQLREFMDHVRIV